MSADLNRLRWQCRRGHLELDLCLQQFLESSYSALDVQSRSMFSQLLSLSDEKLFAWLVKSEPVSPEYQDIVAKIRGI